MCISSYTKAEKCVQYLFLLLFAFLWAACIRVYESNRLNNPYGLG